MKNNKKVIIVFVIIVLIIILISSFVFALFTSRKEDSARIRIGNLDVILVEDWPDEVDEIGIDRNTKKVKGESVADKKAYVRMRFIPIVEYFYEEEEDGQITRSEWRTAPISQDDIKLRVTDSTDNWVKQGDYYYYKKILNPREETEELDLRWEVTDLPTAIARYDHIKVDVRVLLEYSQTSNELWKEIFQIEDLPASVERVEVVDDEE